MTDLFTEAVRDAEKLMEIAEADAKKALIEQLTPYIKKVIVKEAVGTSNFFLEQDEDDETIEMTQATQVAPESQLQPQQQPQQGQSNLQGMNGAMGATAQQNSGVSTQSADVGLNNASMQAPVPTPDREKLVGASMPDEDGKIVVDFEDLFVDADTDQVTITPSQAPVQPTGAETAMNVNAPTAEPVQPSQDTNTQGMEQSTSEGEVVNAMVPVQPTESEEEELVTLSNEAITYKEFNRVLSNISERIDRAYFTGRITDIKRSALKQRLIDLIEALDSMRDRGLITNKQARLNENKLEFLFLKLKEAGLEHSYLKKEQGKGTDMTSLKEFAAKLFEEDEKLEQDSEEELEVKAEEELAESACDRELPWDEAEAVVSSKKISLSDASDCGHCGHCECCVEKDADEDEGKLAVVEFEVDDNELAEAVRAIRKESIKRKLEALREASDGKEEESWEDAEPEGGEDDALKNLKEEMSKMDLDEMMHEMMHEMEDDLDVEDDADIVLSVDLPPEVERELAQLGVDDLDVDVELNVEDVEDLEDEDNDELELEDDEEIEIVDDEDDEDEDDEDDEEVEDDMDEMKMPMESVRAKYLARKNTILEKRLRKAAKLLEARRRQVNELNRQLNETNLFTSKAVYYSKFLQRALSERALTKKALQQIVEHLDKGRSVAETKAIYTKIKRRLDEHASASRKLGGSSSTVAKPGSANLTEAARAQAGHNSGRQSANRWQVLAGIKKND